MTVVDNHVMGIEQLTFSGGNWESLFRYYRDDCGVKVGDSRAGWWRGEVES